MLDQYLLAVFWFLAGHKLLIVLVALACDILKKSHRYYTSPLRKQGIPGPLLAKFTNLYRFYGVLRRNWHRDLMTIHDRYGSVVWIAPDEISISDPYYKNLIYGFADQRKQQSFFQKGPVYTTGRINDDFNFLFETDPERSRAGRYTLSHFYSESGLLRLEGDFDKMVDDFIGGLQKYHVKAKELCNFSVWSTMFMVDLTTQLACNYSSGLLKAGRDNTYFISGFRLIFDVVGTLMPIPLALRVTTRWTRKMLLYIPLNQLYRVCLRFTPEVSKEERIQTIIKESPEHLLSRFSHNEMSMRRSYPEGNRTEAVTNNLFMLIAGSVGVTSNVLPSIMRQLIDHPNVLQKVREELQQAGIGLNTVPISSFQRQEGGQCNLPYLEAVILETLRVQPLLGFGLSRVVPPVGCKIKQYEIPPGYIVGMSSFPTNHDTEYFGEDAAEFKPERWLGNHPSELSKDGTGLPRTMKNYLEAGWLSFGAGARMCVGRHLAIISLTKATVALVQHFDMELVKPATEWFGFSVHLDNMMVRVTPRKGVKIEV